MITPFTEMPLMHNRLTHSEKVAQVARSIAEKLIDDKSNWELMHQLGGFDVHTCEAAGLAHDLGHPPFGHIGEEVLDKVAREELKLADGFEGNAQTLRMVTIGKSRSTRHEGLDLTYSTLSAIAKYPWARVSTRTTHEKDIENDADYRKHWKKFNAYSSEYDLLKKARNYSDSLVGEDIQTLEASVMDVADDITYAVHDLEDFYLAGILNVSMIREDLDQYPQGPFKELATRLKLDYPGWFDEGHMEEAISWVESILKAGFSKKKGFESDFEAVARTRCSQLVGHFIEGVRFSESGETWWSGGPYISLTQERWHQIQVLKSITKSYVIQSPDIALLQRGQQQVLEKFAEMLKDWSENDPKRLPPRLRSELTIAREQEDEEAQSSIGFGRDESALRGEKNRVIIDYICSLTDVECLQIYYKLSGMQVHKLGFSTF